MTVLLTRDFGDSESSVHRNDGKNITEGCIFGVVAVATVPDIVSPARVGRRGVCNVRANLLEPFDALEGKPILFWVTNPNGAGKS